MLASAAFRLVAFLCSRLHQLVAFQCHPVHASLGGPYNGLSKDPGGQRQALRAPDLPGLSAGLSCQAAVRSLGSQRQHCEHCGLPGLLANVSCQAAVLRMGLPLFLGSGGPCSGHLLSVNNKGLWLSSAYCMINNY